MKRLAILLFAMVCALPIRAQEAAPLPHPAPPAPAAEAAPPAQVPPGGTAEFLKAADEVLAQMSQILDLPIKEPLKKSLRSKPEIRAYLIREENEDTTPEQRYSDDKALEAFGLIPRGFPLDSFLMNVLTDQVAGLYDPQAKEFYIADWIPADEQKPVMAHELTHALDDQSFGLDHWIKAARPNDDAELARDSVSEGSAMAAMVDYSLRGENRGVRDLPDVTPLIRASVIAGMQEDPALATAPMYIRDSLIFPYLAGMAFSQQFLKAHSGWADFKLVFQNPPVSTQQILHPDLYAQGVKPQNVTLPEWKGIVPRQWKLLEENVMGEFGLEEVLKQFLGETKAGELSPAWAGDRYAVFEDGKTKQNPLVLRLALDNPADAVRFFDDYTDALEQKYKPRSGVRQQPQANFLEFRTDTGGVFLRCRADTCVTVEGASRETYDKITAAIGWPPAPELPPSGAGKPAAWLKTGAIRSAAPRAAGSL